MAIILPLRLHGCYEGLIDLQGVNRESLEITERRIPSAKVIDAKQYLAVS
jgi:hypothetical protein